MFDSRIPNESQTTHTRRYGKKRSLDPDYGIIKARAAERFRQQSESGRDIGEIPPPQNTEIRNKCRMDLQLFLEVYFPNTFRSPFSPSHVKYIQYLQNAILNGGYLCIAVFRSFGKTAIATRSLIWAMFYGHSHYCLFVACSQRNAETALHKHIKMELRTNKKLYADFPEFCIPCTLVGNTPQRAKGLLYHGKNIEMEWGSSSITMAWLEGYENTGCLMQCYGIDSTIRGISVTRPDGFMMRPDLCICDDPQTDESARSFDQCNKREGTIVGTIMPLGEEKPCTVLITCTVIEKNDVAERFLDKRLHPDFRGLKMPLCISYPRNMKLWDEYANIRSDSLWVKGSIEDATEFYRANRDKMDEGAVATWESRYVKKGKNREISAIQHIMERKFKLGAKHDAEDQQEPYRPTGMVKMPEAYEIMMRLSHLPRGTVPSGCPILTAGIDVHDFILYWTVIAVKSDFTTYIVDYGTFPKQGQRNFRAERANPNLQTTYVRKNPNDSITAGIKALLRILHSQRYAREDGMEMPIQKILIDQGYLATVVKDGVKACGFTNVMTARGYSSKNCQDISQWKAELKGEGWIVKRPNEGDHRFLYTGFDANFYKTRVINGLMTEVGAPGAIMLFGEKASEHENIASHFIAEEPSMYDYNGTTQVIWSNASHVDNHWLDCLDMAMVAASQSGAKLIEQKRSNVGMKKISITEQTKRGVRWKPRIRK